MTIGTKLKESLQEHKMTQKELAEKLFTTPQAVSKWIKNESEPSKENIKRIYEVLGLNLMHEMASKNKIQYKPIDFVFDRIETIDSIEKAKKEAERILDVCLIKEHYSYPVFVQIEHLLTATIGLTYHHFINDKKTMEDFDEGVEMYFLNEFFEDCFSFKNEYHNELEYKFYLMGIDYFESWGEYKIKNHEYCGFVLEIWENFLKAYNFDNETSITIEFKTALSELLGKWGF